MIKNPYREILMITLLLCGVLTPLFAQQVKITGTVSDPDGITIPGVSVSIKGTNIGTVTDLDGNYGLVLDDASTAFSLAPTTVKFSSVGFVTQEQVVDVPTSSSVQLNVQLEVDLVHLEEVVVVGYGVVNKKYLTGSVSSIKSEDLGIVSSVNPLESLKGRVPGVQIANSSGAPGAAPVVRIRGVGTPGNSSPLYVVDGVLINDISFLNSADIQSMDILKDASSTAIYGSRGANGVIIVTTKLGELNQKPTINVSAEYSLQVQQTRIDLLNGREYATVVNAITPNTFNNIDAVPNTDWQDLLFEVAPIQNYQVSVIGASDKNQYYFGLGYFNQKGIIPESGYKRITLKVNEKYSPKDFLSFGTNFTITPYQQNNSRNEAPFSVYRASPVIEPFQNDGSFSEVIGVGNVLADLKYTTDNQTKGVRSVGNIFVETELLDGLKFKSSFGLDATLERNESFTPVFFVSAAQSNDETRLDKRTTTRSTWVWENTFNYDKKIGQSRIGALVGYTVQEATSNTIELTGRNLFRTGQDFRFIDPGNIDPDARNSIETVDSNLNFSMISFLARVNYAYRNRYLLTFTFRRDGSSKFLGDNRYGNFPAVAAGWNLIDEPFLASSDFLSNLKLRASWGVIGNEKVNYTAVYSTINNNINGVFGSTEQTAFGQTVGASGNPNLTWEEVEQLDIGVELGLMQDKLSLEVDYYDRKTKDILINLNVPDYFGNGSNTITFNAGGVQNKGIELNLNWRDKVGQIGYSIGFQGATVNNKMTQVSGTGGVDDQLLGFAQNRTVSRTVQGLPIGAFYGYVVEGVFQSQAEIDASPSFSGTMPGDLRFADTNQDGVLNGDDRTFIGSPIPDLTYGISINANWKGFDLNLLFQGQTGSEVYNIKETVRPALYNYESHVLDFWNGPGTSNSEPRPTVGGNNWEPSTRFIQSGDFFRLRSVSLSYSLSNVILEKLKMNAVQIYLRGANVFTISQLTGYSPELASENSLTSNIDTGTFPVPSIYTIGLNLTF